MRLRHTNLLICTFLAIILALSAVQSLAEVRPRRHDLVSKSMKHFMSLTPRIDPVAAKPLASDRDVYLHVRIGAAAMEITALARPAVNPIRLARALESAMYSASPGNYDVGWSNGSYSAARTEISHGRFGALEASNTYSIGKVIATMRSLGFAPRVFLGRLRYTESADLGAPRYLSPNYAWYSLTNVPPNYHVAVRGKVTLMSIVMLVLFGLVPVALQAAWFATGVSYSRRRLIPRHTRSGVVGLFVGLAVVLAMASPPLAFIVQGRTGIGLPVSDVWFGSIRGRGIMDIYLYLAFATLVVGSLVYISKFAASQRRFARALEAEDPYQVPVEVRRADTRERLIRLGVLLVGFGVLLAVSILIPNESPLHRYAQMAVAAMTGMGAHLLSSALSYKKRRPVKVSDMDELYRRVSGVAGTFGIGLRDLQIEEGIDGHRYVDVKATRDGRVLISRKAIEIMTPDELDYLIGMEFAGRQTRMAYPRYTALAFLPALFLVLLTLWVIATEQFRYVWLVILANIAVMFGTMALWNRSILRARPTGAPLPAQMASNPDAARSAIAKKLKYSQFSSRIVANTKMAEIIRQLDPSSDAEK